MSDGSQAALQVLAQCQARKLQKTNEGTKAVTRHKLSDGQQEKALLQKADAVKESNSLGRVTLKPEERFLEAHRLVMAVLKANRGVKMTAEDIQRETRGKSELVDHFKRHGIDICTEKEFVGKDGRQPRTLQQILIDTFERQSADAAAGNREQAERLLYEERTQTFRWRGVYSDIRCKDHILTNLEEIDEMAHEGETMNIGIELRHLRDCYPGSREDVLDLILTKQVHCLVRSQKKAAEVTVKALEELPESAKPEERRRIEEEILENGVVYWKSPEIAKEVEGVDPALKELWRAVGEEFNKRQDLLQKFRKSPKLQSKLIQAVEDTVQRNSSSHSQGDKGKREGRERSRILNNHMPNFDFSKPFDKVAYDLRMAKEKQKTRPSPSAKVAATAGQAPNAAAQGNK